MKKIIVYYVILMLLMPSIALADSECKGKFFNPITQLNWDMIFPMRIMGVKFSFGHHSTDSPATVTTPVCICPGRYLGLPMPGITVSYHEPLYMEEITKTPGCLSSLGGINVLHGFDMQQTNLQEKNSNSSRWQVHWYEYPIFMVLDAFKDFVCMSSSGFALAYLTEIDPTWQNDIWSAIFAPEAILFANPIGQAACIVDAATATAHYPIDVIFWCAGSWGSVYPESGTSNADVGRIQSAELEGAKMIARLANVGLLWDTVGKLAKCKAYPMPIWRKSEFSVDPVYPQVYHGNGIPIGAAPVAWQYEPISSRPMVENINQIIFQEQQCCLRP